VLIGFDVTFALSRAAVIRLVPITAQSPSVAAIVCQTINRISRDSSNVKMRVNGADTVMLPGRPRRLGHLLRRAEPGDRRRQRNRRSTPASPSNPSGRVRQLGQRLGWMIETTCSDQAAGLSLDSASFAVQNADDEPHRLLRPAGLNHHRPAIASASSHSANEPE
jgi:hypothetical protein